MNKQKELKEKLFSKENISPMVLMATVFMYVFIEIAIFGTDIASVVKWIAIPMCMASIFKFIADICEDINDRETIILKQKEQWASHLNIPYNAWKYLQEYSAADSKQMYNQLESMSVGELEKYHVIAVDRTKYRKIRKTCLFLFYLCLVDLFLAMLLHTQIEEIYPNVISAKTSDVLSLLSMLLLLSETLFRKTILDILAPSDSQYF